MSNKTTNRPYHHHQVTNSLNVQKKLLLDLLMFDLCVTFFRHHYQNSQKKIQKVRVFMDKYNTNTHTHTFIIVIFIFLYQVFFWLRFMSHIFSIQKKHTHIQNKQQQQKTQRQTNHTIVYIQLWLLVVANVNIIKINQHTHNTQSKKIFFF